MIVSDELLSKCGNIVNTFELISPDYETVQYLIFTDKFNGFFEDVNGKTYTTHVYNGFYFPVDENGMIYDGYSTNGNRAYITKRHGKLPKMILYYQFDHRYYRLNIVENKYIVRKY